MSEIPPSAPIPDPMDASTPPTPRRRAHWQIGLGTVFLLIAALAVWMTDLANRRQIDHLNAKIETMLPMARELVITDPSQIAVVKRQELWFNENQWSIHLPPGQYRLSLALEDIDGKNLPPHVKTAPIPPGRHLLALEQSFDNGKRQASILLDDTEILRSEVPDTTDHSGSQGGGNFTRSEQRPPDKPVILFERRYMRKDKTGSSTTPPGPTDGLMLWIEPETNP
jgi:hypothetical protein